MNNQMERNLCHVDTPTELALRCPHNNMAPCITNDCAAWRFVHIEDVFSPGKPPPGTGWLNDGDGRWLRPDPDLGYCGLAGRP